MSGIEGELGRFDGGRVLDVATRGGRFVQLLMSGLKSYEVIVGIDINEKAIEAARDAIDAEGVSFSVMDAQKLEFEDESFDTVTISASLHHMQDIQAVLLEMKRVLKPGGRFIVAEMHRDARTEPELTSVHLHGWAAEVDSASGRFHNQTLTRSDILSHFGKLDLRGVEDREHIDTDLDPMESSKISEVEEVIEMMIERAAGVPDRPDLVERGQELVRRLHDVGFQGEPVLFVTGEK